jgi:hypothetical protein
MPTFSPGWNDDVAGHDGFAAELLHTEVLRV